MKSLHRFLAASMFSLALPLVGCAAPADGADSAVSDLVPLRPDQQRIANVSKATIDANIVQFRAQNPQFSFDTEQAEADVLTGAVRRIHNDAPQGPRVTLNATQAVATATAFVEQNLGLFHIGAAELASATVEAAPYPFESGNYPWSVSFDLVKSPPGYEGFDAVVRRVSVNIELGKDGRVADFFNGSSGFPGLLIETNPALAPSSPELVQHIIGTDLVWQDHSFIPQPDVAVGAVTAADILAKAKTIHVATDVAGVVLTLAYEVRVRRGGHDWKFVVHSRTGAILEQTQLEIWEL